MQRAAVMSNDRSYGRRQHRGVEGMSSTWNGFSRRATPESRRKDKPACSGRDQVGVPSICLHDVSTGGLRN